MESLLKLQTKPCANNSAGLQLIPSVFEFSDPQDGVTYEKMMKFTNLSKRPIKLLFKNRIDDKAFQLRAPSEELILASGLTVTVILEFTCRSCLDEMQRSLTVYVADEPLTIPIIVQNSKPSMDVTRFVDFGKIIADGRIILSKLFISNWGEKAGNCHISYEGSPLIFIEEKLLSVPPNVIREVTIELRAVQACKLREILKVKLDGRCAIDVQVWAETIESSLQLLNEKNKEHVKCLKFGSVYYGSMAMLSALLYNNSPEPMSFVTILDVRKAKGNESADASLFKDKLLDPATMFSVTPHEGTLQPYEYMKLHFKFSPSFTLPKRGWTCLEKIHQPARKDYTVYITIDPVGIFGTLLSDNRKNEIEIGCVATVLPIDVCFYPNRVRFEVNNTGEVVKKKVKFTNMSAILPLHFCIKPAGFIRSSPKEGLLKPHEMIEIIIMIKPDHYGKFKAYIPFDVYGYSCSKNEPNKLIFTPINTIHLECFGLVNIIEVFKKVPTDDKEIVKNQTDKMKKQISSPNLPQAKSLTAVRPRSVKSLHKPQIFRSIYTRTKKQTTKLEQDAALAKSKIQPEELRQLTKQDIGMIPQAGLESPDFYQEMERVSDVDPNRGLKAKKKDFNLNTHMTKIEIEKERKSVGLKPVLGGLKPYPETNQEKIECKLKLSPSQIYLVMIGPAYLNFGDVCENSTNNCKLFAVNCHTNHVFISFVLPCCEVKFGCPLTMVLPPKNHTEIPIDFEPTKLENFHKSIKYLINCCHEGHIVMAARVVKPMLTFRPRYLVIEANITRNASDGYHGIVTLTNPLNHAAKFEWSLNDEVVEESAYTIYPKSGYVEAYCSIDCEVVYSLAKNGFEGQFILSVKGGEESILDCHAQLDPAKVIAVDENIGLGPLAFHLPVEKMCILKNTGLCHAFYQVSHIIQVPSPTLTPTKGILSAMDLKELKLRLCPDVMGKVDQRLYLNIKNGKTVEFKITGQVEPPLVELNQNSFNFRTVPCGGWKSLPCLITNKVNTLKGKTKAELEFDFRGYVDFSIIFHRQKGVAVSNPLENKDVHKLYKSEILSGEVINAEICFHPVELAAYDFTLTLDINSISSFLNYDKKVSIVKMTQAKKTDGGKLTGTSKAVSDHYAMKKTLTSYEISLPVCHISAVATPQIILIKPSKVRIEMKKKAKVSYGSAVNAMVVKVTNLTDKPVSWFLNLSQCTPPMDDPIFLFFVEQDNPDKFNVGCELLAGTSINMRITFHPVEAGVLYRCQIPIIVRTLPHPVGFLSVEGILQTPKVAINPPDISLPIVPLNITVHAQFYLNLFDQEPITIDSVQYPRLTYYGKTDETWPSPHLEVSFPNGNIVKQDTTSIDNKCSLAMLLSFRSSRPVFFSSVLILNASDGNQFHVPVSGGSENCIISTNALLQNWRPSIHISLPMESDINPELMALMCSITNTAVSRSQSSESSFDLTKSDFRSSVSDSVTVISSNTSVNSYSATTLPPTNDQISLSEENCSCVTNSSECFCRAVAEDPLTIIVERWFSVHGFPSGMYPIKLPESMTRALFYTQMQESRTLKLAPLSKLYSTIFDCIHTLTGRMILTNVKITLSVDPVERANQLYGQTECLIRFLQAQNGCCAGIKPEYLLSYKNYLIWLRYKNGNDSIKVYPPSPELDRDSFREMSTRFWTQYLLQIYKTLVLYRICRQTYPSIEIPKSDGTMITIPFSGINSYSSNLYSSSERIILIWLNKIYESELENLCAFTVGEKPTKRWIVNFDTNLIDSLPFAAIFSAYASIIVENKLKGMYGRPTTPEQIRHNATRIISILEDLGKEYDIKPTDITNPHPVAMLMFCVFLFERIPNLLPKATILFRGYLNIPVVKQMTLTNPGTKMIGYKTLIAGAGKKNYTCTHTQFTIAPNGKFVLSIECRNKQINPGPAVIHFQAKKLGPTPGISMVFHLDAKLVFAQPVETINVDSNCYDQKLKILRVKNFFSDAGIFNISIHECMYKEDELAYNPESQCELIRFFHCSKTEIFLDSRESTDLNILFTPLLMNKRQCFVIFSNDKIGDFVYSIVGDVSLPTQMPYFGDYDMITGKNAGEKYLKGDGIIYVNCTVGDNCVIELPIPFENVVLTKALVQASQMYLSSAEYIKRQGTDTLETESLLNMFSALLYNYASDVLPNEYLEKTDANEKLFHVEMDCEKFEYPTSHKVIAPDYRKPCPFSKHPRCKPKKGTQQSTNLLIIKIQPLVHGYFLSRLSLKSPRDIRVYQIQLCSNSRIPLAFLEFSTPAHQAIAQDIPITNITSFDWSLTTQIEGRGFSGPLKLDVPSHSTQNFALVFWPMKESTVEGSLKFVNEFDCMEYNFNLLGKALHPFPFVSHTFLCQARQLIRKDIEVPNITLKKFTFQVESDLIFLSGPPTISVPPLCKGIYPLEIYCLTSGHFTGTLSFRVIPTDHEIDSDGDELEDGVAIEDDTEDWIGYIVWASLDITASPAAAEKTITISCNLMESTVLDTTIKNPTLETMILSVQIEGEGLNGSNQMHVNSGKKEIYRLSYTPYRIGHADGRLIFCHPEVGEFWYYLKLLALPPLPTYLPDVPCQLGKTVSETLVIKNCCNEQVSVDVHFTDTLNYTFGEGETSITLPASSELPVVYRFTPSGIQRFKNKFSFSSKQLGDIVFYVQGVGLYPTDTINIHINTPLGMTNSFTINFLNPTVFDAYAKIIFKEPGRDRSDTCFTIPLEHLEGIFLKGRAEFQIPIFFRARHMREYKAMLLVSLQRADKKLWLFLDQDKEQPKEVVWTYHIYGIPEYTIDRKQRVLKCQAKKVLVEQLILHLHHCVPPSANQGISLGSERFTYQIQVPGKETLLNNFTKVSLDRESWDCKSNVAELVFRIEFYPLVTMKVNAPFTIRSTAGGIWKLPLSFIATEPDADNNIIIKAIDSDPKFNIYEIRLRSPTERPIPFHAYFLPKSDNDFKIYPESGILPSSNAELMKITVAYIPKNYVKVSRAKLMIQADECEWLYDILGYPPQYKPPVTTTPSIVTGKTSKTTLFGWK